MSSSSEAPLISKALKLVSFAIIVAIVALALSAVYSGYEEYGALTNIVGSSAPQNQLNTRVNGSELIISGLEVPNKMTYPLSLDLLGAVSWNNVAIGKFETGASVIQPGQSQNISADVNLNFSQVLKNSAALQIILFNSSTLTINTTIAAGMIPLVGINLTESSNSTEGPLLSGFAVNLEQSQASLSPDGQYILVPMELTWTNQSPFEVEGLWLNATLTGIPGRPSGDYGSCSGQLNLTSGPNNQTFVLKLPTIDFSKKSASLPAGNYTIKFSISQSESSPSVAVFSQTVNI
jgi:hypothetical protein